MGENLYHYYIDSDGLFLGSMTMTHVLAEAHLTLSRGLRINWVAATHTIPKEGYVPIERVARS